MPDYFQLLGLSPAFAIRLPELEAAYFKQQRLYHPDRFVGKPAEERQQALQRSVDINNAYETLKNPLPRAQYLLYLQDIHVGGDYDSIKPSPSLLMETMEWREQIDEAEDTEELDDLETLLGDMMVQSVEQIEQHWQDQAYDAMADETLRLGYLLKTQEAADQRKIRMKKQAS